MEYPALLLLVVYCVTSTNLQPFKTSGGDNNPSATPFSRASYTSVWGIATGRAPRAVTIFALVSSAPDLHALEVFQTVNRFLSVEFAWPIRHKGT